GTGAEDGRILDYRGTEHIKIDYNSVVPITTFSELAEFTTRIRVAGPNPLLVQRTTDSASVLVAAWRAGDRATPLDDDEGYFEFNVDDSTGTQREFARLTWVAVDNDSASKDGEIQLDVMLGNTLRNLYQFGADGVVVDVTNVSTSFGFSFKGPTGASTTPAMPGCRIRADVGGADALERMDSGFGGQGGANMEFYSIDHLTRAGRLGLTYGAQGAATGQFLVSHNNGVNTWVNRMAVDNAGIVNCFTGLNVVEEDDAEGLKLQFAYSAGNTSSRVFFAERDADDLGFSLVYAGAANPTLGGKAHTLGANRFYLQRYLNSTSGATVMAFNRDDNDVAIPGALVIGADAAPTSGFALDVRDDLRVAGNATIVGTVTGPSGTWDSGGMDIATGDSYAINGTDVLTATVLGSGVLTSSLTTVGALNAGSITSGFGNIDIGASAFTTLGFVNAAVLNLSRAGSTFVIQNTLDATVAEVGEIKGPDRGVPAQNNRAYITLKLKNSAGSQVGFGRLQWAIDAVGAGSEAGRFEIHVITPAALAKILTVDEDGITAEGSAYLLEKAAPAEDMGGYGQLWVKNTTPTELWFTDDVGTDTQIV
ncbi:hypothetical protein LCGC14_1476870, partial [marine sediment metagenome]